MALSLLHLLVVCVSSGHLGCFGGVGPRQSFELELNCYFFFELEPNETETLATILVLNRNETEKNTMVTS